MRNLRAAGPRHCRRVRGARLGGRSGYRWPARRCPGDRCHVYTDDRNSDRYLVSIDQGGLGLPHESYYRDERFAGIRASYLAYLTELFALAGEPDPATAARGVPEVETKLAAGHWLRAETLDVRKTCNLTRLGELTALAPEFDWRPASLPWAARTRPSRRALSGSRLTWPACRPCWLRRREPGRDQSRLRRPGRTASSPGSACAEASTAVRSATSLAQGRSPRLQR